MHRPHIVPLWMVEGGKLRMIEHYFFPMSGGSVNDAVDETKKLFSFTDF